MVLLYISSQLIENHKCFLLCNFYYLRCVITVICLARCDQYRWVYKGTYPIKHDSGIVMKKKSSTIDVPNNNSGKGDDRFRRF